MLKNIKANILIVDDDKINRILISETLKFHNIEHICLGESEKTMDVLRNNKIDLILLDIVMPNLDGYEVCKLIKKNIKFKDIPVIFLTASNDEESIVKGFEAGGQDFIIKPFNMKELMVRIRSSIDLKKSKENLRRVNRDLNDFMYIASHDLQSPLVSMSGFASMFIDNMKGKLTEEELFPLKRIEANSKKMQTLIKSLLDVSRLNTVKNDHVKVNMNELYTTILNTIEASISDDQVKIIKEELPDMIGDKIRLEILGRNIISNAIKYGAKNIKVGFSKEKRAFFIKDDGIGIEPEQLENIFKPGSRLDVIKKEGVGMGLSFCKKVVQLHNGEIWAESEGKGKGTTIFVSIP